MNELRRILLAVHEQAEADEARPYPVEREQMVNGVRRITTWDMLTDQEFLDRVAARLATRTDAGHDLSTRGPHTV